MLTIWNSIKLNEMYVTCQSTQVDFHEHTTESTEMPRFLKKDTIVTHHERTRLKLCEHKEWKKRNWNMEWGKNGISSANTPLPFNLTLSQHICYTARICLYIYIHFNTLKWKVKLNKQCQVIMKEKNASTFWPQQDWNWYSAFAEKKR